MKCQEEERKPFIEAIYEHFLFCSSTKMGHALEHYFEPYMVKIGTM